MRPPPPPPGPPRPESTSRTQYLCVPPHFHAATTGAARREPLANRELPRRELALGAEPVLERVAPGLERDVVRTLRDMLVRRRRHRLRRPRPLRRGLPHDLLRCFLRHLSSLPGRNRTDAVTFAAPVATPRARGRGAALRTRRRRHSRRRGSK